MIVSVDLWATCQGNIRVRVRVRVGEGAAGAIALAGKRSRTRLSAVRVRIRVQVRIRDRARVRTRARVGVAARVRVTSCAGSRLDAAGRWHGRAARPRSAARMLAKLATHPPRGQPRHHALLEPRHGRAAGTTGSGRSPRPIQQRPQTMALRALLDGVVTRRGGRRRRGWAQSPDGSRCRRALCAAAPLRGRRAGRASSSWATQTSVGSLQKARC